MALELRAAVESVRHDDDTEMTSLTCSGVPGVLGAVIDDFDRERCQVSLERLAYLFSPG